MKQFKEHFGEIHKIIAMLDKGNLTIAYQLIPAIHKAKLEFAKESSLLAKFGCLQNYEHYFETKLEVLKKELSQSLEQIFVEWEEAKFQACLRCYYMFQLYSRIESSLITQVPKIIKRGIKLARNQVIELYIHNKSLTVIIELQICLNDRYIQLMGFQKLMKC